MGFYDLSKEERIKFVQKMESEVKSELKKDEILENSNIFKYASDNDSYIRKNIYLIFSRLYRDFPEFQEKIISTTKYIIPKS